MSKNSPKSDIFWHQAAAKGWDIYGPPVRPSLSELKIIENFIKRKGVGKRVLILGATPENRDLAHKLKSEVTICDISLEMMMEMTKHMKYKKKTGNEIWVKSDWLKAPLKHGYWDIALGDWVVCNVPFNQQEKFFQNMSNWLAPSGYFITRMFFVPGSQKKPEIIIEEYQSTKNLIKENEFALSLLYAAYNPKTYEIKLSTVREYFKKYLKGEDVKNITKIKKSLKAFNLRYPGNTTWWATPAKMLDKILSKYFKILQKESGSDHQFTKYCPIYLLEKK